MTLRLTKRNFHATKQSTDIRSADIKQIVIPAKFKHSNKDAKYFIGYAGNDVIKPLCIVFPQLNGYIKYFENGRKNISFRIEDDRVLIKFNEIWNKIKGPLRNT